MLASHPEPEGQESIVALPRTRSNFRCDAGENTAFAALRGHTVTANLHLLVEGEVLVVAYYLTVCIDFHGLY
jgi:hypothetical protein